MYFIRLIKKRIHFVTSSLICNIFQGPTVSLLRTVGGPWTSLWKPLNPLFVMLSHGLPPARGTQLHVKPEKPYSYCDCFLISPSTAKTNAVCSCVSSVMVRRRSCRPTEPTRTRWVRLRVGLNTHAHAHTLSPPHLLFLSPCLLSLFITLSFLSEPL